MQFLTCIALLLFFSRQEVATASLIDESCTFALIKYTYASHAAFQYVPTAIVDQTVLNITADVVYYRSQSPCQQAFIKLENITVHPSQGEATNADGQQLEHAIEQIFRHAATPVGSTSEQFHRLKTVHTNQGRFRGNSIFANYLLNKLFAPTVTTCDVSVRTSEQRLETSTCLSTTAGLLTVSREIHFHSRLHDRVLLAGDRPSSLDAVRFKSAEDFRRLLNELCASNTPHSHDRVVRAMSEDLGDADLQRILAANMSQMSACEWKLVTSSAIEVNHHLVTEYVLKHFSHDPVTVARHLDVIERRPSDRVRQSLRQHLNRSDPELNFLTFRMLVLAAEDSLTMRSVANRSHSLIYRVMALRTVHQPSLFLVSLRHLIDDEDESAEMRIAALQAIRTSLNGSELERLLKTTRSSQVQFYLRSLSQRSSIWSAQSGTYTFPFGRMAVIFNDHAASFLPSIMQFELANQTEIDVYIDQEILLVFGRKATIRFSTTEDLFNWLNSERLFEIETLDGSSLRIHLNTDLNLDWLLAYFDQGKNFFRKSSAGLVLSIQHGLKNIMTGYEFNFQLESDFRIPRHQHENSTSYVWRSTQKENILFKIQQSLRSLVGSRVFSSESSSNASPPTKDFCYVLPHFDSKVCLSILFQRLWPTSVAIRLLADDPTLIYNLTISERNIDFHIQQHQQVYRSYRLTRHHHEHAWMPDYVEFSTPTTNYTSSITWHRENTVSFNFTRNNQLLVNASGDYQYDAGRGLSIQLTSIQPKHIGPVSVHYDGNLTINASKLLGGQFLTRIRRLPDWQHAQIEVKLARVFFFFKQNLALNVDYDLRQPSFNVRAVRNEDSRLRWMFTKGSSSFHHLLTINTSLIEVEHVAQARYKNLSNMAVRSSTVVNGWSLWNITARTNDLKHLHLYFNGYSLDYRVGHRTLELQVMQSEQKLVRAYVHINQSNFVTVVLQWPGHHYNGEGQLSAQYTNVSLHLPITGTGFGNHQKQLHLQLNFTSFENDLLLKITFDCHGEYSFHALYNLTFHHHYLLRTSFHQSLVMSRRHRHPMLAFHSSSEYLQNSTTLLSWNGSLQLPPLLASSPLLFYYQKDTQLFVRLFQWANFTRTPLDYRLSTTAGLQVIVVNEFPTRIHARLEQYLLGKPYLLLFELDRHWMMSLVINRNVRYEFVSSPLNSSFTLKRTDMKTNESQMLPISYRTDNQTLLRLEIAFSKFVSKFLNDFVVDISLRNHSLKLSCHIPAFKREFLALTWSRSVQREVLHFHGLIEFKLLRRRHWLDLTYDWNLASIRSWTFETRLNALSFEPIHWSFNITNDYLWYGRWAVNFRMMLGTRRQLIGLHHQYHYTTAMSNLIFDLQLVNTRYDLDFNYYHSNHSIGGRLIKDRQHHPIDGYWNATANALHLNTPSMRSTSTITSTFIKSIVDAQHEKIGVLFERTTNQLTSNDSQIAQCNPYLTVQLRPRLLVLRYFSLNDGLSIMMFEWSTRSYLSWNYTGHGRPILPVRKLELDLRTKYIFHCHTATFKYAAIYNNHNRQLTLRRVPTAEDADDRTELKIRNFHNHTWLFHLQVINNHYVIFADPNQNESYWNLHGRFQSDRFTGSLWIPTDDWYLSSKLNFNSSLFLSTGRYAQLFPTTDPQLALDIRFKSQFRLTMQYAGLRSLFAFKYFHNASNTDVYFSSISLNDTTSTISFRLNDIIKQSWTLVTADHRFCLSSDNSEFLFNGSLQDFSSRHLYDGKKSLLSVSREAIEFVTDKFGIALQNLSSETTRHIHVYNLVSKENLTVNYYKSGQFAQEAMNIQTPIYDVSILYHPNTDDDRYMKVLFELLPLQMSSFSFVRGRTFRLGYQTSRKQLLLSGNLAFGLEDFSNREKIVMNERWKLTYGFERSEKLFFRWKLNIDAKKKTIHGHVSVEDPNGEMSSPVHVDINGHLIDTIFNVDLRSVYSSHPVLVQMALDRQVLTRQHIALKLLHEPSRTNLSFSLDHYPRRKLHLRFKPNHSADEKTLIHLYANTTETQLHFLASMANFINFNLTLPKSYPETGFLHSAMFIDGDEYFDGRFDAIALKIRSKDYLFNLSTNELVLQNRQHEQILAAIHARWLDRNSSTALLTLFSHVDFARKWIPASQVEAQKTWLRRLEQAWVSNRTTLEFEQDLQTFVSNVKEDFIRVQGEFGKQLAEHLRFDDDLQASLQRIDASVRVVIGFLTELGFRMENGLEEFLNNLTCLDHRRHLLRLDLVQLVTSFIDAAAFATVSHVNRSFVMFDHFARYPRSISAVLTYLTNDVILQVYPIINDFYLETKQFVLSKLIQYLHDTDFVWKLTPLFSNSISYFHSRDIQVLMQFATERLRRLLSVWLDSPAEYKVMKTFTSELVAFIDKLRFYIDDKLDFLLPAIRMASPRISINGTNNQTFLVTWLNRFNVTSAIAS